MIEKLGYTSGRIFHADLLRGKYNLRLTEACDGYYNVDLTRAEVIELANDFLKIAESMNDYVKEGK